MTTHTMPSIADRLDKHHLTGFVAMDSVDALADRILAVVRDRQMIVVRQYRSPTQADRLALDSLDMKVHERDHNGTRYPGGIHRWTQGNPVGKGLHLYLTPGLGGFGIGAYEYEAPTEQAVRDRYHDKGGYGSRRDVTLVRVEGWPGDRNERTDDYVHIEHWNEHGVCVETLIRFVPDRRKDDDS